MSDRADLEAENAKLRAELDALRAAPSAEEIEAWRKSATRDPCRPPWVTNPDAPYLCGYWLATSEVDEAVALMRRAPAAPAPSALRDVVADLRASLATMHARWMRWRETFAMPDEPDDEAIPRVMREAMKGIDRAAAPEAKEPSGVVVPEEVRADAAWVRSCYKTTHMEAHRCANWILSLLTPQPAAALDDTRRAGAK